MLLILPNKNHSQNHTIVGNMSPSLILWYPMIRTLETLKSALNGVSKMIISCKLLIKLMKNLNLDGWYYLQVWPFIIVKVVLDWQTFSLTNIHFKKVTADGPIDRQTNGRSNYVNLINYVQLNDNNSLTFIKVNIPGISYRYLSFC